MRDTLPPSPGRGSEGCQRHKVMGEKATRSTNGWQQQDWNIQ